jgi:transcription elongation factor GreA
MMNKFPMTVKGYEALEAELKRLKGTDRPEIIAAIAEARGHGDLSENAEYHAAREKQGFVEGRIKEIEAKLSCAEVINPKTINGTTVRFSATVQIVDEETEEAITYQIVGTDEANLTAGKLSFQAPLARALIGKSPKDSIEVTTPGGRKGYEIVKVVYE